MHTHSGKMKLVSHSMLWLVPGVSKYFVYTYSAWDFKQLTKYKVLSWEDTNSCFGLWGGGGGVDLAICQLLANPNFGHHGLKGQRMCYRRGKYLISTSSLYCARIIPQLSWCKQ